MRAPPTASRGENETLDPVAGHVPGARNHPFAGNLDAQGRFRAAPELRQALGGDAARHAGRGRGRDVRLGRHRLPQPARARGGRTAGGAAVRRLVERVDPRPGARRWRAGAKLRDAPLLTDA